MRNYELMFVVDPRVPDEDVVALTDEYKKMLSDQGATVTREESWGKRRLAYPIHKLEEGKYVLLYVEANGANPFPEVEQRMRQNEHVLRYLTVRTDAAVEAAAEEAAEQTAETEAPAKEQD